ncbi:MAG: hypothetical protein AAFZ58_07850, partial [Pseudomonadota bacterium]
MRRCASGERRRTQSRVAGGCIAIAAASACADASLDIGHFDAGSDNRAGLVFSPDGQTIAFVGNYDDGTDLYQISVGGGVPQRLTYHPASESLCD